MNQDIKQLKAQSHSLKPVVIIGNNGLTEAVHQEIECALEAHELIKIKMSSSSGTTLSRRTWIGRRELCGC